MEWLFTNYMVHTSRRLAAAGGYNNVEFGSFHYTDILDFALQISKGVSGSYNFDVKSQTQKIKVIEPIPNAQGMEVITTTTTINLIDNTGGGTNPNAGVESGNKRATKIEKN